MFDNYTALDQLIFTFNLNIASRNNYVYFDTNLIDDYFDETLVFLISYNSPTGLK